MGRHARVSRQDIRIDVRDDPLGQEFVLCRPLALSQGGLPIGSRRLVEVDQVVGDVR
jgi:hypothetical protein